MTRKRKQIRWLKAARDEFAQIVEDIAQRAPAAAARFAEKILAKVELLGDAPQIGLICPYYRKARQVIYGNYVVYYTVHRQQIVVRAVVHGARLFRSEWLQREG